ncbi:hypothetical protein K490DRAFT_70180 [Saccharata proteae CBS 121410]|uniref:Uncharacterized protein n=1 Tax=Saccharata proteae CBS 121410 TaxID=1314787 RepID=A0A9P4HP90_9PEZI|nr:hypothetical protein K490DRAFT_70180 [Saccharata proteae CBS 121410]
MSGAPCGRQDAAGPRSQATATGAKASITYIPSTRSNGRRQWTWEQAAPAHWQPRAERAGGNVPEPEPEPEPEPAPVPAPAPSDGNWNGRDMEETHRR